MRLTNRGVRNRSHIGVNAIGVGRFRILGVGQGLEYWEGQGGANSQQAHDVVLTSMRRSDVASTSFRRHVPTRCLINQCQIITNNYISHLKI